MIINKITLKNFFRYGNNEQTLNMSGNGITGVTGLNGYGKSSCIIDSLLFAFYGKYRTDTIDGIVNRYIGKDCKVGVEFTIDNESYKVIRYRKHTTHNNNIYLFKGDKDISCHTASETNNIIIDLIKMPYIAFINSCIFSTELYSAFLANKVSERLVVFENILSLKEATTIYTETKSIIKEINNSLIEFNTKKASIEAEKSTLSNTIDTYSSNAKTKLLSMKVEKDYLNQQINETNKKIEELSIINVNNERLKLGNTSLKEEYLNQIKKLKIELNNLIVSIPIDEERIIEKYKNINFEENKNKELKYKEDSEILKIRENGYKLSLSNQENLKQKINELNKNINNLIKEKEENISKIVELQKQICPFCGQHLSSEKAEKEKEKASKKLEEIELDLIDFKKEVEQSNISLNDERENYNFLISDYNRIKENLNTDFIPNTELAIEQYNSALNKLNEIQQQNILNSSKKEEIEKEINSLKEKAEKLEITNYTIEELNSISSKIEENKKLIQDYEKQISAINASVSTVYDKTYIEDLKSKLEVKNKDMLEINNEIEKVNNDLFHYSFLADCFSNKSGGFKKYFIGEMIDLFNTKINQYLPFFFTEDVKIEFDKDLNDKITMDGYVVDFNSFSQGQRQRAELAINFALFSVARVFFSNDNNLLIMDEMDKGLDKYGLKAMLNLLNGFDKQLRIFIVSHNPLLEEEISSKIKIERDENGFSKIVA